VSFWRALAGGFVGTLVLTSALMLASELGFTRMDVPFLLGTAVTADRTRARVIGYVLHFLFGLLFALGYWATFLALGHGGWLAGALLGVLHALFAGTTLVNVLLPAVHPRMGTPYSSSRDAPLLEPPGFMLLNYGRATPVVTVLGHVAYGAIIGFLVGSAP
jgi:hypothetical protein